MMKNKILVIGKEGRLARYTADKKKLDDYDISYVPVGATAGQLLDAGKDASYVIVDAIGNVPGDVIRQMPELKLIHSEGVGYQGVDIDAADERGIYVCNCKGMNAAAVAEQAVLLMLGLLRDVAGGDRSVRAGEQIAVKEANMMAGDLRELGECRVGLIGLGDIGKATAGLLSAFGAEVIYHKPHRLAEADEKLHGVRYMELDELLACSDIVSLHLPVNGSTRYMADSAFFAKMKDSAYLINTSRSELVNSQDLVKALENGEIAGAGLDTIYGEPVAADNDLLTISEEAGRKLLLSCHIGGITGASFRRGYDMIWSDIEKVRAGEKPDNIVNHPELMEHK